MSDVPISTLVGGPNVLDTVVFCLFFQHVSNDMDSRTDLAFSFSHLPCLDSCVLESGVVFQQTYSGHAGMVSVN